MIWDWRKRVSRPMSAISPRPLARKAHASMQSPLARSKRSPPRVSAASPRSCISSKRTRRFGATSRSTTSATSPRFISRICRARSPARSHTSIAASRRSRPVSRTNDLRVAFVSAPEFDVVVIGGGHNGLVCAAYLAAAGASVCVIERRHVVGGAAVTEEFHPGFRNSTASYTVSLLDPDVIRDLRLAQHGLTIIERPFANFLPLAQDRYLKVGGGLAATQAEVAKFSARDAERLPQYYAMLDRASAILRELLRQTPPNIGERGRQDFGALFDAWKVGRRFRTLELGERRDLLELMTKSAGDVLDRWFESAPIKAAFGFDSIVGNFASPYQSGSAYVLLHHVFGEVNGKRGQWGHALGGMGAITQAMARECASRGVEIRINTAVASVVVERGRACGVEIAGGDIIQAKRVVANVNPKLLFEQLVPAEHVDADFRARIASDRCGSGKFRMDVELNDLLA